MKKDTPNKGLGNPAAIAVASAVAPSVKVATEKTTTFFVNNAKNMFLIGAVGFSGYKGYQYYKNWKVKKYLIANGHRSYVRAALIMYRSIHKGWEIPLGWFSFGISNDGTDEETLNYLAKQITNIKDVSIAYNKIFNSSLHLDVQNDLNSTELLKFYNLLEEKAEQKIIDNIDYENLPRYVVGENIWSNHPNGAIVLNKDGSLRDKTEKGKKIGVVLEVIEDPSKINLVYRVDVNWSIDFLYGNGYVNAKQVINQNNTI